jgi:hypothetical protein
MALMTGSNGGAGARVLGVILVLVLSAMTPGLGGCAEYWAQREREQVAKGWCKTIRASQVIPVYPLTEDLRPGDVFLVRRSIAEQNKEWEGNGYLVLDDARVRLGYPPSTANPAPMADVYKKMYFDGYFADGFGKKPNDRIVLKDPGPLTKSDGTVDTNAAQKVVSDGNAPRAAFPTYSFQVRQGSALGAAVPIQGIPVAMSFMQSGSVDGTVTIADAYTYAGDPMTLYEEAIAWAKTDPQPAILGDAISQNKGPVFLRVITRVYLTGAMAVSLTNSESGGANVKAGEGPDAKILANNQDFKTRYDDLLKELSDRASASPVKDAAGKLIPGVSVQFAWATERSVALNEKFPTPLVVGYLGLDIPVFVNDSGEPTFGYPLPTWSVLNQQVKVSEQTHFNPVTRDALKSLVYGPNARPEAALKVMRDVADQVAPQADTPDQTAKWHAIHDAAVANLAEATAGKDVTAATQGLYTKFDIQSSFFTSRPELHATLDRLIDRAYRAYAH